MPVASNSVGVKPQPRHGTNHLNSARSSEGDQAGHAADFIDSIGQLPTSQRQFQLVLAEISAPPDTFDYWQRLARRCFMSK